MRCPTCGAETKVLATRQAPDWTIKRTRQCDSGHRFATYEVLPAARASKRDMRSTASAAADRVRRWGRDEQIRNDPRPTREVARDAGITTALVRMIRAQHRAAIPSVTQRQEPLFWPLQK